MRISGIDEAGLGPILGPYCAASVRIEYTGSNNDPFTLCPAVLSSEPSENHLAVGDSKKIFSPGKIGELEKTVLSFHSAARRQPVPESAYTFLSAYTGWKEDSGPFWSKELKEMTLPLEGESSEIGTYTETLQKEMGEAGLALSEIILTVQSADEFNCLLKKLRNKATVCQEILTPLVERAVHESDTVIVDRQGGRRYYGDWLINLFPGHRLAAQQELKDLSRYTVDDCRIDFQIKADALNFETALASMFAKYARELSMTAFNSYWEKKAPGIKATAGYYTDGLRFVKELKEADIYPAEDSFLLRKK